MKPEYLSFDKLSQRYLKNIALISPQRTLTFQDLVKEIAILSGKLQKNGISSKTKVAILSKNSIEYILSILSLFQLGAVTVPVNIRNPFRQIITQLNNINCEKILVSKEFQQDIYFKEGHSIEMDRMFTDSYIPDTPITVDPIPLKQIATILFTSGSSGKVKAVVHTTGNHYFSALGSNQNIPLASGDRWLVSLPLYHVGGLSITFRTLLAGAAAVIGDDIDSITKNISSYDISHLSLVPIQLMRLISESENIPILHGLKAILLGGSAVPKILIDQAIENDLPVHTSYGSTEMSSQITTTRLGDRHDRLRTSGAVLKYRMVQINRDGEIWVKGDTLFKGYMVKNKIKNKVDMEGWFHTGDLGHMDSRNYLTVLGRKDNMFISGGENIYPEEIERHLLQIDGILDAMVVDVPDEQFGTRPVAFVKVKENITLEMLTIQKLLEKRIARFKIPKHIFNWPKDFTMMKPNRSKLRKRALRRLIKKGA